MILFFNKPLATWLRPMGDKLYFYDQELTNPASTVFPALPAIGHGETVAVTS